MTNWNDIPTTPPNPLDDLRNALRAMAEEEERHGLLGEPRLHILHPSIERGATVQCECGCGYLFRIRNGQIEHARP